MGNKYTTLKNIFIDVAGENNYINLDKSIIAYKKILDLLQKPAKLILFCGKPGCGKTFLLKKIVSDLKDRDDIIFFPYPFFNETEFVKSLYEGIFKKESQEKIESYEQFIKAYEAKIDNNQDKKPIIVILDESQLYPEILLEKIINNWRKVYGAILGFIVGLTVINYGILKAIVVFAFAFIGYKLGDSSFTGGIKKIILKRLKED